MAHKPNESKALLVRFSALGDVALTVPAVYSVCQAYPRCTFVMLTKLSVGKLFVNPPANLIVEAIDVNNYKGVLGLRRLLHDLILRHGRFDLIVDLHDVLRSKILRFWGKLAGIRSTKIRKDRVGRKRLISGKSSIPLPSSTQLYGQALNKGGFKFDFNFKSVFSGGKAPESDFSTISLPKKTDELWIGIAPFAAHQGKIYPLEKMREVVLQLSQWKATRIFIFGAGKTEKETAEAWASEIPNVISLAGKRYGFPAEMAIMSHFDAMLTMDSANMHLAALAGAPTLSIWGPTHPNCGFRAWGSSEANIISSDLPCRPCSVFGKEPCRRGDWACMHSISPDAIITRIKSLIDKNK